MVADGPSARAATAALSYPTPLLSTAPLLLTTGRELTPSIVLAAALIIGAAVAGMRVRA